MCHIPVLPNHSPLHSRKVNSSTLKHFKVNNQQLMMSAVTVINIVFGGHQVFIYNEKLSMW